MKKLIVQITMLLLAVLFVVPVVLTFVISFSQNGLPSIQSYKDLLLDCFTFYPMFWNSMLYSTVITAAQLVVIILAAFGFSTAKFRGKGALFVFYIILMMMPLQVTILPNYIGLRDMGMLNTRLAIILPMVFSPFGVVVMHQYMKGINTSIIEACRIETSSIFRIILASVIPQIRTCIFAVVLFTFAESWNMLEQPMLFLNDDLKKTVTVFISNAAAYEGEVLFPAAVIFMIPVLLLYLFFNESLEKGLALGDIK